MEKISLEICNICKTLMVDSRILQCAHSFCLKCLESSINSKDSPKCPTCQIEFQIPEGGMEELKKNEFIEQLNNLKQSTIICESCIKNQAIKFCVDCSFNYCSTCLVHHGRIPSTNNHQLQATTPTKEKINTKKYQICKEHSDVMNLFCKECEVVVCDSCLVLNHSSHCMKHVSQVFESMKIDIEENLRKHEDIVEDVVANHKKYQAIMESNEVKASDLKKEIQERGEDLKKVVDSIVDELIENVDKELKRLNNEADDVLKELKNMETNLNAQIESLKQQLSNLNYENMFQSASDTIYINEFNPKLCPGFNVKFLSGINQPLKTLKGTFGTLKGCY